MGLIEKAQYWVSHHRMLASLCLALILFVFAQPSSFSILLGLPFLLLGETIRIYSVGTIKKNVEVTQEGPYSITRNPLYLGNLFLVLGFSIISNEWILVVIYLGLFYFIYDATIKDEEQRLLKRFGKIYEDYTERVPRFFPNKKSWVLMGEVIMGKIVFKRRELNTCFGIILGVILAYFKMLIVS